MYKRVDGATTHPKKERGPAIETKWESKEIGMEM